MREYLSRVAGNEALRARLGDEIARGAVSHAYILEGPCGSGKHTLAREVAMALSCEKRTDGAYPLPCGICPTCRKIREGKSPDVITVSREEGKATMGVDVVRALRADVPVLPNDLEHKIYVIEDAHTMTTQAQNALLLTLEEPPPFVMFLLLTERVDALLETIRSRAPVLRMQPIGEAQMREYLCDPARGETARTARTLADTDPDAFAALLRMANGTLGRANELLEDKKRAPLMARRAQILALCEQLGKGTGQDALLERVLGLGNARDELTERLLLMKEALRDLLLLGCTDMAPLLFFTDRDAAIELAARFSATRLQAILDATDATLDALSQNANARLTMIHYLCRLTAK